MKRSSLSLFSVLLVLSLSACGGVATPTMDVAALQQTALANAWLAMTQTQAALPTPTATETPTPLPTLTPVPTLVVVPTLPAASLPSPLPAAVVSPTTNPCYNPPPLKPQGTTVKVKFVNKSGYGATLHFGMNNPNDKGECATYSFTLGKYDEPVVTVLAGCYWAYAYTDKPSTASSPQPLCVFDTTKAVAIWVTTEVVNFH